MAARGKWQEQTETKTAALIKQLTEQTAFCEELEQTLTAMQRDKQRHQKRAKLLDEQRRTHEQTVSELQVELFSTVEALTEARAKNVEAQARLEAQARELQQLRRR